MNYLSNSTDTTPPELPTVGMSGPKSSLYEQIQTRLYVSKSNDMSLVLVQQPAQTDKFSCFISA